MGWTLETLDLGFQMDNNKQSYLKILKVGFVLCVHLIILSLIWVVYDIHLMKPVLGSYKIKMAHSNQQFSGWLFKMCNYGSQKSKSRFWYITVMLKSIRSGFWCITQLWTNLKRVDVNQCQLVIRIGTHLITNGSQGAFWKIGNCSSQKSKNQFWFTTVGLKSLSSDSWYGTAMNRQFYRRFLDA